MEVNKLSGELKTRLIEMSEIAHSDSMTNEQKNSKLNELKNKTLDSIEANEIQKIGFVAKNFLDDIKKVIESESWKDIPSPKSIENEFSVLESLAEMLNALQNFVVHDFSELNRWIEKILLDSAQNANKAKVKAQEREIKETNTQFEEKDKAIQKQFSSAYASAIASMVVSVVQVVASGAAIAVNSTGFFNSKKIKTVKKEAEGIQDHIKDLKQEKRILNRAEDGYGQSIKTKRAEIARKESSGINVDKDKADLADMENYHLDVKEKLRMADKRMVDAKAGLRSAMNDVEELSSQFQYASESMRVSNELISATGRLGEAIAKYFTAAIDREAAIAQLDAEKAENRKEMERRAGDMQDRASSNAYEAIAHIKNYMENMMRVTADKFPRIS